MSANLINENKYYVVLLKRDLYWISSWAFALKVFMILLALLIQKPSKSSKAEEDNKKLVARLQTWKELNILDLLLPGQTVQERLKTSKRQSYKEYKIFSKNLMFKRKVNAALKMLSDSNIRVHTVNDRLLKELSQKRLGSS